MLDLDPFDLEASRLRGVCCWLVLSTNFSPTQDSVSEVIPVWKETVMVMSRVWQTLCAFLVSQSFHLQLPWRLPFWNFLVLIHEAGELWKHCFSSWSGALPPPAQLTDSPDTPVHPYLVPLFSLPVCLLWVTCDWFCASKIQGITYQTLYVARSQSPPV